MRAIVLFFLAVACVSVGITAYFALGFTVIEAFLVTIVALLASFVFIEAKFRRRTESYLVTQTEEIARQLNTVAKTSELISDQVTYLSGLNINERADNLEADVSVLGTVVRQLAEAVAEIEENQLSGAKPSRPEYSADEEDEARGGLEVVEPPAVPGVPIKKVQEALAKNQIEQYLQPIVGLPQRRPLGYELMPKLITDDGVLHHAEEFLHHEDATGTISEVEQLMVRQAANIIHRSNVAGDPTTIFVPISNALLTDRGGSESVGSILGANRAVSASLVFLIAQGVYDSLRSAELQSLDEILRSGAKVCIDKVSSLRLSYQMLSEERKVRYVRADAQRFIANPLDYTDYHRSDLADFVGRYEIGLIMENVEAEEHILELLDDNIPFAQGNHIAPPSPVRPDLTGENVTTRRAAN